MPKLRAADRAKRSDSAALGRPHAVTIRHGGESALRKARLDARTREARFERELIAARLAHLGGPEVVTEPQASLVRHSARLELLATLAWAEVVRHGGIAEAAPAFAAFVTAGRELREVLRLLGLERRAKPVPSLEDYLQGRAEPPAAPAEVAA